MALPLVPFIAGAVIGGAAIYLYRDKKTRKRIKKQVKGAADKVSGSVSSVRSKFGSKKQQHEAEVDSHVDEIEIVEVEAAEVVEAPTQRSVN